ncbi:hypothetical protein SAMN05421753_111151 [Planctomicrobium piriforme]|uniref:Uncharacterized protein n=1 Tax=Planctomicrobium piriforme TaxID=1576369 RepID=A0A1I3K8S2_9PLAN|nr:hypothetical protein SAMN05421753_111151 [Planctomicrobium piriforme]
MTLAAGCLSIRPHASLSANNARTAVLLLSPKRRNRKRSTNSKMTSSRNSRSSKRPPPLTTTMDSALAWKWNHRVDERRLPAESLPRAANHDHSSASNRLASRVNSVPPVPSDALWKTGLPKTTTAMKVTRTQLFPIPTVMPASRPGNTRSRCW